MCFVDAFVYGHGSKVHTIGYAVRSVRLPVRSLCGRTMFEARSDEFTVKVTDKTEEVKALLETGFEYVCQKEGLIFLRKRK